MRSAPRARRKVLQRSKKREEAGRGLRPLRSASHGPDASSGRSSLAAHAGGRKAVSDPQGCGSGGRGSALPTCGLLGDPGLRAVGLRGRPRPRRWPRSLPRMLGHRWRGKAASGAPTPPLVSSVEPEDRSLGSRPSCAVWLRDPAAGLGVGGDRVSPPGPPAHSRVSLPPIPLHERPEGRGVSATRGGAGYNQSQAGNSSRGALAGLREWGGGAAGAEAGLAGCWSCSAPALQPGPRRERQPRSPSRSAVDRYARWQRRGKSNRKGILHLLVASFLALPLDLMLCPVLQPLVCGWGFFFLDLFLLLLSLSLPPSPLSLSPSPSLSYTHTHTHTLSLSLSLSLFLSLSLTHTHSLSFPLSLSLPPSLPFSQSTLAISPALSVWTPSHMRARRPSNISAPPKKVWSDLSL